jgi:hypothetical protein
MTYLRVGLGSFVHTRREGCGLGCSDFETRCFFTGGDDEIIYVECKLRFLNFNITLLLSQFDYKVAIIILCNASLSFPDAEPYYVHGYGDSIPRI